MNNFLFLQKTVIFEGFPPFYFCITSLYKKMLAFLSAIVCFHANENLNCSCFVNIIVHVKMDKVLKNSHF